jgi:hypothetical protein
VQTVDQARPKIALADFKWAQERNSGRLLFLSNGVMPQNHTDYAITLVLKIGAD